MAQQIPPFDVIISQAERSTIWFQQFYDFVSGFDQLKQLVIKMGSWDMDALDSITIPLRKLSTSNILGYDIRISPDSDTDNLRLTLATLEIDVNIDTVLNEMILTRNLGGFFDSPSYSDPTKERGSITFLLE